MSVSSSPNGLFFIVGAGRSGTTLLRLMLSGHSRLHVTPETWFIAPLVARLQIGVPLDEAEREWAVQSIVSHYRWPDLGVGEAELRAELARSDASTLRDVTDAVYACVARAAHKPRIGDKTPTYVRILPQLAALYPEAQFIHLLRDGRDVALSYIDAGWKPRCYEGARFEWTEAVRAARSFGAAVGPARWHEVRYEDLVQAPAPALRALCAFLGEAFEPAMLNAASRAELVPERERKIHPNVGGKIDADRAGAWQQRLAPGELFVLESCLGPDLAASGYRLRYSAAAWRPVLGLARAVLNGSGDFLMRALPALQRRGILSRRALL